MYKKHAFLLDEMDQYQRALQYHLDKKDDQQDWSKANQLVLNSIKEAETRFSRVLDW